MAEIDVIITNHNYEEYLRECLTSVADQTFEDWHCIVVDDASEDASISLAQEFCTKDARFSLMSLEENKGVATARNAGIDATSSSKLIFLDADDYLLPPALDMLNAALADPDIDFAYCQPQGVNFTFPDYDLGYLLVDNYIAITTLVRREALGELRFEPSWPILEDWIFWGTLGISGAKGKLVNERLFYYRMHEGSRNRSLPSKAEVREMRDIVSQELMRRFVSFKRSQTR